MLPLVSYVWHCTSFPLTLFSHSDPGLDCAQHFGPGSAHSIIAQAAFIMSQILKMDRRFRTEGTSRCQCFLGHYSRDSLEEDPKEPEKGDVVLVC